MTQANNIYIVSKKFQFELYWFKCLLSCPDLFLYILQFHHDLVNPAICTQASSVTYGEVKL